VTWELLVGGGALALAGAIYGLWQRVRAVQEARRGDQWQNRAEKAEESLAATRAELAGERAAWEEDAATREAVVAAQRVNIGTLERELEKHAARSPELAGDLLLGVLGGKGQLPAATPEANPAGVRDRRPAGVGPTRRGPGR
jgi:hypothetical protein